MLNVIGKFFMGLLLLQASYSLAGEKIVSQQSIISENSAYRLNQFLMRIPSDDPVVNAVELNQKLLRQGLPIINHNSIVFNVQLALNRGFADSNLIGAEFDDGAHKFCLPCETGHNNFKWGIFPYIDAPK